MNFRASSFCGCQLLNMNMEGHSFECSLTLGAYLFEYAQPQKLEARGPWNRTRSRLPKVFLAPKSISILDSFSVVDLDFDLDFSSRSQFRFRFQFSVSFDFDFSFSFETLPRLFFAIVRGVGSYLKLSGLVAERHAPVAGGTFYSARRWVGNCPFYPPAIDAPVKIEW